LRIIGRAIAAADGSGKFRRRALGVKARIALMLRDYQVVEAMLMRIMQLKFTPEDIDTGIMCDFVDRLPPGTIDPEVACRYDEYCRTEG